MTAFALALMLLFAPLLPAEEVARVPIPDGRSVVVERDADTGAVTVTVPTAHGRVVVVVDGPRIGPDPTPPDPGATAGERAAAILAGIDGIEKLDVARTMAAAARDAKMLAEAGRLKGEEVAEYWQATAEHRLGVRYQSYFPAIREVARLAVTPDPIPVLVSAAAALDALR